MIQNKCVLLLTQKRIFLRTDELIKIILISIIHYYVLTGFPQNCEVFKNCSVAHDSGELSGKKDLTPSSATSYSTCSQLETERKEIMKPFATSSGMAFAMASPDDIENDNSGEFDAEMTFMFLCNNF